MRKERGLEVTGVVKVSDRIAWGRASNNAHRERSSKPWKGIFRFVQFQAGDDNNIIQYKEITFGRCSRPAALLGVMYFV